MGLLKNSVVLSPGSDEGWDAEMAEKEHHQDLDQIIEQNFIGMEGQAKRGHQYLVG